jgi:uridine phosphorylase
MLRETAGLVSKRKEEGCIAVEMEVAGVEALCDFYGLDLFDFLEAGDVLEESGYEVEDLPAANHSLAKLHIALSVIEKI